MKMIEPHQDVELKKDSPNKYSISDFFGVTNKFIEELSEVPPTFKPRSSLGLKIIYVECVNDWINKHFNNEND